MQKILDTFAAILANTQLKATTRDELTEKFVLAIEDGDSAQRFLDIATGAIEIKE
jgi:hypothetical protein